MKLDLTGSTRERKPEDMVPPGTHDARCFGVVDLGTCDTFFEGKPTGKAQFIRIFFEFPDHLITYTKDDKEVTAPKSLYNDYKVIGGEKSNLVKLLIAWAGTTDIETHELVGRPASVTVVHKPGKEGTIWANIGKDGVKMFNEKYLKDFNKTSPMYNEDISFSIKEDGFDSPKFEKQWKNTKATLEKSYEYLTYKNGPIAPPTHEDPFK